MNGNPFQAAVEHHQAGRLDQAEFLYREVLREDPRHADALHLLGVIAHQKGLPGQAIRLIQQALALNPETATYHTNLAEAYRAAGDLDQAAAHCRHALRLQPNNAEAHNNLGLVLQHQGNQEEAIAQFEAAIERKPLWVLPYFNLGGLLHKQGRAYEAVAIYREGLNLCGPAAQLHGSLGQVLLELGQAEAALFHCQEAVRLQPAHPMALTYLGNALCAVGYRDEGRGCYQRAIQLAPGLAMPCHRLGLLLAEEGKFDDSISWHNQAIRLEPDNASYHCSLANAFYENEQIDEAVARYRLVLQHHPEHVEAHNSLGYLLQDLGDMLAALAEYREAVRIKPGYSDAHLNRGMLLMELGEKDEAIAAFREALRYEPHHPEALGGLAMALRDKLPAADLATMERLLAVGRMPDKRRAVLQYSVAHVMDARNQYARAAGFAQQANQCLLSEFRQRGQTYDPAEHHAYVDQIIQAFSKAHFERVRAWGLDSEVPVFVLGLPRSGTSLTEQILASHPRVFGAGELIYIRSAYRSLPALTGKQAPGIECIGQLDPRLVRTLAQQYLDQVRKLVPDADRIVDKMPDNYLMVGLIATLFPRARIIHMRRDVRDIGLSCWMTLFRHIRWACDLEHIGTRIREYQRLMDHWREVLPVAMLELDYEEIVSDLEATARRLVAWCGLDWDPACLAFHQNKRVVRTASMAQVRAPIYTRSVGRWKHYREFLNPLLRNVATGNDAVAG
jgi:tetratricopeptide (TPR) repeat protein